eukprot:tig00000851_g4912.t1
MGAACSSRSGVRAASPSARNPAGSAKLAHDSDEAHAVRQPSSALAVQTVHLGLAAGSSTGSHTPELRPKAEPHVPSDPNLPNGELLVASLPPRASARSTDDSDGESPRARELRASRSTNREFRASLYFGQMSKGANLEHLVQLVRTSSRVKEFVASYARGVGVSSEPPPMPEGLERFDEFLAPPVPDNEEERIKTLWAYNILDSGLDNNFSRIVQMAKGLFQVPIALVSLVDANRQWFKAVEGLGCFETGRDISFCGHAILQKDSNALIINDATQDWRFANNPLVTGDPFIRFYAGAPLRAANGTNLGTLCIIDRRPRELAPVEVARLKDLAAVVVREIELFAAGKHLLFRSRQEESIAAFSRHAMALDLADEVLDLAASTLQEVLEADFLFLAHGVFARGPASAGRARPHAPGPSSSSSSGPASLPMRTRTRQADPAPAGEDEEEEEVGDEAEPAPRPKLHSGGLVATTAPARRGSGERGLPLGPGTMAAFVAAAPERSVHIADTGREIRFAVPAALLAAGANSGAVAAVMGEGGAGAEPFAYLGAFSSDPRRLFNDEIRLYLARFAAAMEAVLAQWRGRQALRVSEQKVRREKQLADRLLKNTLPESVVAKLLTDSNPLADLFEETTIVFADIVGFTALSSKLSASEVVQMLNRIFSRLDHVCARAGCEKIKTIGDCYMAAAGVPARRPDHADVAIEFAIATVQVIAAFNRRFGTEISVRVGVHSGPVVAGVIGSTKFLYDLWGDTVNVASRMESAGVPGRIQASAATYQLLSDKYDWVCRGDIEVKGKEGVMRTYLWNGRLPGDARGAQQAAPPEEEGNWDAELNIRGTLAAVLPGPGSCVASAASSPVPSPSVRRPSGPLDSPGSLGRRNSAEKSRLRF